MNPALTPTPDQLDPLWNWLRRLCLVGAVLAVCILGASILLRLTTVLDAQGNAVSLLEPALEHAVRTLHRVCASGVALLALCAFALCWRARRTDAKVMPPAVSIVASTVVLALIGPLTSGYRLGSITVVNVTFGMVLSMAFWWLREIIITAMEGPTHTRSPPDRLSWLTFGAMVLHLGTGAAASAWEMHGIHWPAYVHLVSLLLCLILVGVLLFGPRPTKVLSDRVTALAALLTAQLVVGGLLMWQDPRPVALSYFHAMLSPLVAMAAVTIMVRGANRRQR